MDRQTVQKRFGIIGESPGIHHVIDRVRQVARTDISVLIEGESGVGKELIAQAIHELSLRRHKALKVINTGAIPEGLIESELFGAEKGAYTGATERRRGLFEEADGGTIFLDEIGEMPQSTQVRLLRVLESGTFNRVGSTVMQRTDARVVAATNKNLGSEVADGRFREDLYYRLSTVIIHIPPLRERRDDIRPIFDAFLYSSSQKYQSPPRTLTAAAYDLLESYQWPGNVRELRNVADQVVVLHRGANVDADDIRPFLRGITTNSSSTSLMPVKTKAPMDSESSPELKVVYRALLEIRQDIQDLRKDVGQVFRESLASGKSDPPYPEELQIDRPTLPMLPRPEREQNLDGVTYEVEDDQEEDSLPTIEEAERELILKAMEKFDGNRKESAKALGISPRTLYRKLKELDEDPG
ncbi:MAG: sigma-54 dependent transcriptional regulator [Bacteroidota bacterium]|nr:sigma-54 dependent transcriptional regulator [Bacteroidota bacterium]MDE2644611.1 sigma-54 dependent transcriptional regulator [Bacteroidota bacterium]MXW14573.1 sigma-54-dependent Fis family transcriptional regulator [Rhodothermaceae bacterium]MYC04530.1 sigma-54-dependent Fis family transcriptional regulator [Rhodothermaceae bacterium]MYI18462.1 sigma-54-dependent Fis family transcriptional regulator [Rhodothermaceae bacterium]